MKGFRFSCAVILGWLPILLTGPFFTGKLLLGQDAEPSQVGAPATGGSDTEDSALTKAIRLLDENRLDEALEFAKRAEEASPEKIETWIVLGKVLLRQGTAISHRAGFADLFRRDLLGTAEENFRKALNMDPSSLDAGNHLCFTLFLLKNIPAAEDMARKMLEDHPDDAYAHYILGKAMVEQGQPDEAIPCFRAALSSDPLLLDARISLILALVAVEKRSEASKEQLDLCRMNADYDGLSALAQRVYEADELYTDAIDLYKRLLEITPGNTSILYRMGWSLYCLERFGEAEKVFDEILAMDPNHEKALYQKGYIRLKEGKDDEAYALFKKVLEQGGEFSYAIENHLQYLVQKRVGAGDYAGAVEIMDFILKQNPFNIIVMANRALTLSNWGKNEQADAAYEELIKVGSWDSSFLNDYALHLLGTGRIEAGLARLEQAVQMDENIDSMENLGSYHYYQDRDLGKAQGYLEKVVIKDPERTKALVLLEDIELQTLFGGN